MTTLTGIPTEVLFEILCKLPCKALLRFRCVNKEFNAMITDPFFVSKHCQSSASKDQSGYIVQLDNKALPLRTDGKFKSCNSDENLNFQYDLNHILGGVPPYIVGSCHGLLCLRRPIYYDRISLPSDFCRATCIWNPSIRVIVKEVPDCFEPSDFPYSHCLTGFGYGSRTNDYKVVHIVHGLIDSRYVPMVRLVYSLAKKSWRYMDSELSYAASSKGRASNWQRTYFNGAFYWIASDWIDGYEEYIVVKFCFSDETFGKVRLTFNPVDNEEINMMRIGSLKDSLVVFVPRWLTHVSFVTEIWVLKDDGYFTKLLSFGREILYSRIVPLNFVPNSSVLLMKMVSSEQLRLYDLEEHIDEDLGTKGVSEVFTYSESLVEDIKGQKEKPKCVGNKAKLA